MIDLTAFFSTLPFYLVLGVAAGVVAGLFGIGGGLIIVPVLIAAFSWQGVSPEVLTHMAVGTSLATIVVTSISSTRAHHKAGAVQWRTFALLSLGIALGSAMGVVFASHLAGPLLQRCFGGFVLLAALNLLLNPTPAPQAATPSATVRVLGGLVIGGVSTVFGIGGGTLSVPFLSWCRLKMQQAVATSAACGIPIAVVGAGMNILQGWGNPALPPGSSGFVYWPACLGIVLTSVLFARVGARWAHRMDGRKLKRGFALFLLLVGFRLLLG